MSVPPFQIPLWSAHPAEGRESAARLQEPRRRITINMAVTGCILQEWNIGESAGFYRLGLDAKEKPTPDPQSKPLLADFQRFVQDQGIEIAWPKLTPR